MSSIISASDLIFTWPGASAPVLHLSNFSVRRGERLFINGASGSGKSTLLSLLAGLMRPDAGTLEILDTDITRLSGRKRDRFRARHIGFVFQRFNLIPYLDVRSNIRLAAHIAGNARKADNNSIQQLLDMLRISPVLATRRADQLSVGQQQRVAVARAMINAPEILIADEPTSSLDHAVRDDFIRLLLEMQAQRETTVIFVSHDLSLQHHFSRSLSMTDINLALTDNREEQDAA